MSTAPSITPPHMSQDMVFTRIAGNAKKTDSGMLTSQHSDGSLQASAACSGRPQ